MINKLALDITDFFILKGILKKEQREMCIYGLDLIISAIVNVIVIILVGSIVAEIKYAIVFLIIMIVLRTYTGGYHANTHIGCNIVFISVYLLSVCIMKMHKYEYIDIVVWTLVAIGLVIVALRSPISNKNKMLTEVEREKYKTISVILYSSFILVALMLNIIDEIIVISQVYSFEMYKMSLYININLILVVITMLIGERKERKRHVKKINGSYC